VTDRGRDVACSQKDLEDYYAVIFALILYSFIFYKENIINLIIMATLDRESVDAGLCMGSDGYNYKCRLSSDACVDSSTFMSSRELETTAGVHGGDCTTSKITQKTKIGSCGEDGPCASVAELCSVPALFQSTSGDCTVMTNKLRDEPTKYGSCSSSDFPDGGNTCFYTDDACDDKLTFNIDDDCTCDKVRVGGCRKKNDDDIVYCGVNAQACDDDSEWLSVVEMKIVKDCYLCRESPAAPSATTAPMTTLPPVSSPTSSPVKSPTPSPIRPPTSSSQMTPPTGTTSINNPGDNDKTLAASADQLSSNNGSGGANIGGIVGGIAGAVIVGVLLLVFVTRKLRSKSNNSRRVTTASGDYV